MVHRVRDDPSRRFGGSEIDVLVFHIDDCPSCRTLASRVDAALDNRRSRVTVRHIDGWRDPAATVEYGVPRLPTMLILRDGEEVSRISGQVGETAINAVLDSTVPGGV